ncbi:MAG TPA: TRAP transporter fused permease subunit, partial [Psychromonas hadalis]|nr:TRAP transporter fused permease subunit [Psychromonas hadalis]
MTEKNSAMTNDELDELVEDTETGGRKVKGWIKTLITLTAISWSLFQLYFSSPFPFILQEFLNNLGFSLNVVFDDTKARSIHLAFALFLAFLSYPMFKSSNRDRIPCIDWAFAFLGIFLGGYYFIFYEGIVTRVGLPNTLDMVAGVFGVLLLLEATRRSLGAPLAVIAILFLAFNFAGPHLPQLLAHKANNLSTIVNQQWTTTEGVFGIALGVSTKFVFLFVLFGALLDKAGAGNYFIKTAFSMLGHLRGGPAKAAVIASGLTGLISGSSIANVVTTGTFTIPMMKKVGFSKEKAGAVEVASSVNGQIMPPVMGAAAFLMVEYVGVSYFDVVRHAILPALISYIALVYIVHLEAIKLGMKGLPRAKAPPTLLVRLRNFVAIILSVCLLSFAVYFGLGWIKTVAGDGATYIIGAVIVVAYLVIASWCARFPLLELDDPNAPVVALPPVKETVNSGLHFLLPVVVLIWCLMVERLSPGGSAFWGTAVLIIILLTQKVLFGYFRNDFRFTEQLKEGGRDLLDGLETGARNMVSIGIATACAGIIVGVVAQTNVGAPLASIVETLSGGNILIMLILVGILSLILGMGLPTTANYIVVSSLLATVIVEVGQQNGLIVPLIAVHLFVFYFGIMADVTPPVGLASFASAAISGGNPIKTSFIAFFYSLRTAILPFLFIFNTDLLLINVDWVHGLLVFVVATAAILVFTAATQKYFFDRCNWLEVGALLLISFMLFRPGYFMERISPSYKHVEPYNIASEFEHASTNKNVMMKVSGLSNIGDPRVFFVSLPMVGETGQERLDHLGLTVVERDGQMIIDDVAFESIASTMGLDWDQIILELEIPVSDNVAKQWMFIPALMM